MVEQVYPTLKSFITYLETYEHTRTHLLDVPLGEWTQTALIDWADDGGRYGQSTALNALYYDTLKTAAGLADVMQDTAQAIRWYSKAERVKVQANTTLYRAEEGRYVSSIFQNEMHAPTPQAQAWALTYDMVPASEQQQVADALLELLSADPSAPNVEIYGMYWVLEALGRTNRLTEAVTIIEQYYGRLLRLGATTWWEGFNANDSYTASLSHGWGGSPTWFLTTHVLGIHRTGPNAWKLQPGLQAPGDLSGMLPLQRGTVSVHWSYPQEEQFPIRLEVKSPADSQGEIVLPFATSERRVMLNGRVVWEHDTALDDRVTSEPDGLHISLEGGDYVLEANESSR
jgi:alpha-L-rhamnosidase